MQWKEPLRKTGRTARRTLVLRGGRWGAKKKKNIHDIKGGHSQTHPDCERLLKAPKKL